MRRLATNTTGFPRRAATPGVLRFQPTVPVPLRPGDADVPLDLQAVLTTPYDVFRYGREPDYARPPAVPLPPADAAWATDRLAGRKP